MSRESESSSPEAPSHTSLLGATDEPKEFKCRKRLYALTLESDAYFQWEKIHAYMTKRMEPVYCLVCEHDGPDYPHIHCLYQYKNSKNISSKYLLGAHIEEYVFSPQKYAEYCKGMDAKHKELGVNARIIIEDGKLQKAGGLRIKDVKAMDMKERDKLPIQFYNIVEKINTNDRNAIDIEDWHKDVQVTFIYGESGIGKTQMAKQIVRENKEKYGTKICEVKHTGSFWNGISTEVKTCIYDDFRSDDLSPQEFIRFIDYNRHVMNVKGGAVINNFEQIIITTVQDPRELYPNINSEYNLQWYRRAKFIELKRSKDGPVIAEVQTLDDLE